jgi:hypothetical protein
LIVAEFREGGSTMRVYQQLGWTTSSKGSSGARKPSVSIALGAHRDHRGESSAVRLMQLAEHPQVSGPYPIAQYTGSATRRIHRSAAVARQSTLTAFIRTATLASEVQLSGF